MAEITATLVNTLRSRTGAPMMKCKAALVSTEGDLAAAEQTLREQGVKTAALPSTGSQGFIGVYAHPGNQTVAIVELACATDFVARSEPFQLVARELAMQVAATGPAAVSLDDLPEVVREKELEIALAQVAADPKLTGKSEELRDAIARNKAARNLEAMCLLTQPSIRDPRMTVGTLIGDLILQVREPVTVRRIARWKVGEPL